MMQDTFTRKLYRFCNNHWWAQPSMALIILLLLVLLTLTGCWQSGTREQTETVKWDKVTVRGSLVVPTADGPKPMPVSFTVIRDGGEKQDKIEESKSGIDGEAIGAQIGNAVITAMQAGTGGGLSWTQILGGAGAAFTAATTGYLALKKREQIRDTKPTKS